MLVHPITIYTPTTDRKLDQARAFLREHGHGVLVAAELLGGSAAQGRCLQLISDLPASTRLTRRHKRDLVWLHRLLMLDLTDVPDSDEAACFAALSIEDPRIEEICLLADRLFDLLRALAEEDRDCPVLSAGVLRQDAA